MNYILRFSFITVLFILPLNAMQKEAHELLLQSIASGDRKQFNEVLASHKKCVNQANTEGMLPLVYAVRKVEPVFVKGLLEAGADGSARDTQGNGVLSLAVFACKSKKFAGALEIVDLLIQARVPCDIQDQNGTTALICAVFHENRALVEKLIRAGADVNKANNKGETPLMFAAKIGNEAIVRLLMNAKADLQAKNASMQNAQDLAATKEIKELLRSEDEDPADINLDRVIKKRESEAQLVGAPIQEKLNGTRGSVELKKPLSDVSDLIKRGDECYDAKNYGQARSCYENAEQNIDMRIRALAWVRLGKLYLIGQGVLKDYGRARVYYERAENQEINNEALAEAWARLAALYYYGQGVLVDYEKAFFYANLAEQQQYNMWARIEAQLCLAEMYYWGRGVALHNGVARSYYEIVATQSAYSWAQAQAWVRLAEGYYFGYGGSPDYVRARTYYELAAKQNENAWAQAQAGARLGMIYYLAQGIDSADHACARFYFELAEKQNDNVWARHMALAYLGRMYYNGQGVPKNFDKGHSYCNLLDRDANIWARGIAYACLGLAYEYGYGVEIKLETAGYFYKEISESDPWAWNVAAEGLERILEKTGRGYFVHPLMMPLLKKLEQEHGK